MKQAVFVAVASLIVIGVGTAPAEAQVDPCTIIEENLTGPSNWAVNINGPVLVQEFKPQRDFTLCGASVNLWCDFSCQVELRIQDGPTGGANVLASATLWTVANTTMWYYFDFVDLAVTKDTSYYIRTKTVTDCDNVLWEGDTGNNMYTRGMAYHDGVGNANSDRLFITYAVNPLYPYVAYAASIVNATSGGALEPNIVTTVTIDTPAEIMLSKEATMESVFLQDGFLEISIDDSTGNNGRSSVNIQGGSGHFDPYDFGGVPVGESEVTCNGGVGSIDWATGQFIYDAEMTVTAAGFLPIEARVYGSGMITGDHQMELYEDGFAVEIIAPETPGLPAYGLVLLAALVAITATWILRRRLARARGWRFNV